MIKKTNGFKIYLKKNLSRYYLCIIRGSVRIQIMNSNYKHMKTLTLDVAKEDLLRLVHADHWDPHTTLGLHLLRNGKKIVRIWHPDAEYLFFELFGKTVQAHGVAQPGLFEYEVPENTQPQDYRIYHKNGLLAHDPYAFAPTVSDFDLYLFGKGVHYDLYRIMGARITTQQGIQGVKFSVWAPAAKRVSLVADFNYWDGRANPMRSLGTSGVWELFIPGLKEGEKYKFEIKTQTNQILLKADPYALASEVRPSTASVVADLQKFVWGDKEWIEKRAREKDTPKPINIYEVHLGSWKRKNGTYLNYRELARELAVYCSEMGFTHVELMPLQEHPLDESWGYQVSGFYAVTSRFGPPEDFQWFVNHLHLSGIGVIMDWVPGHFPSDEFSLGRFDGTSIYEHSDPRQGWHPHWSTHIFNFGRYEVSNFLISNAIFWCEQMHVDGLRVDAVASMLYLDYGRNNGEWIPNRYGNNENLEAIEFLKHLNSIVHERLPGILMIAEESTSFSKVSHSVGYGGLGFDMKWNMGWMNDTLRYISKDMLYRTYHHNDLTFGLLYAFTENFTLVFSHDEVVHGKNSLLGKMPGDVWQKFANLRLLYSYMICQPGKKLLFMGGEIAQWNEWNCKESIEWDLLKFIPHQEIQRMVKEINHFYIANAPLWERDFHHTSFEWVDFADTQNSVISYLRKGQHGILLCVHNFTPSYHQEYFISLHNLASIQEVFNTDDTRFGGSGKLNDLPMIVSDGQGQAVGIKIQVAPLATQIFKVTFW